jgi:lipopolysaccharide export system protein LptC
MNHWIIKSALALITGLMLLSLYLITKPDNHLSLSAAELASTPDIIVEHMHVVEFTQEGDIRSILTTPLLKHYPFNDRSELQSPQVTVFQEQQAPWEITADFGQSDEGAAQITLYDNVRLYQAAQDTQKTTTITTSKLIYHPALQLAQTDRPIELRQPGMLVESVGMFADLDAQVIELLHQVRGQL